MQIKKLEHLYLAGRVDLASLSYSERTDHHPDFFFTKCDGLTRLYSSLIVYSYTWFKKKEQFFVPLCNVYKCCT